MRKYILMITGLIGVSVLGGIGVLYSLVHSAPLQVSNIELQSHRVETRGDTALADNERSSITVR